MIRRFSIALLAAVLVPLAALAQAPTGVPQPDQQHGNAQPPASGQHDMKQMHEQMMAEMAAGDQKLDSLAAQMNAAQGAAKVDAIASVINELLAERKQMREHMASMMGPGGMMGGQGQPGMVMGTSGGTMAGMEAMTFDPVCRARIAGNTAPAATYRGKTYQFCSQADKRAFLKNPSKYVSAK